MTHEIVRFDDYRACIQWLCGHFQISYRSLATDTRIHASYFSRVMLGKADFSDEQLFLIAKSLKLESWQVEYLLLLGAHGRSGNKKHRDFLLEKIQHIQDERLKLIGRLKNVKPKLSEHDVAQYYEEPITAKIHMALTVEKFRSAPHLLARKFHVSDAKLEKELRKLESLGVVKRKKDAIEVIQQAIHLDDSHPASTQNHINWRLESIQYLGRRQPRPEDYHLSVAFSSSEETKKKIKELIKKTVVEIQEYVSQDKEEDDTYFIGFDLY